MGGECPHHVIIRRPTRSFACVIQGRESLLTSLFFHLYAAKSTDITQIALLEWSAALHDLITVSIHTYERAPQLVSI
jgi:hypothetical protein